jgi:hypothetical protein
MSSKAFTRKTFTFLHQVNQNQELPASDLAVTLQLSLHFNEKDQDGRAFPSCKSIGEPIGLSEATVIRSVRRLEQHGHIRVICGQQGKGHPNQYWMIVKPSPVKVSGVRKPASAKPASVNPKPSPVQENLLNNLSPCGYPKEGYPQGGERETDAQERVLNPPGVAAALEGPRADLFEESKQGQSGGGSGALAGEIIPPGSAGEILPPADSFEALRAIYDREGPSWRR